MSEERRQARFGSSLMASRHEMKRWIVAELMKVQTLYQEEGLEIRFEESPALYDGFSILLRMPGREIHEIPVPHVPGHDFQYGEVQALLDQVADWVGVTEVEAGDVAYLPPGVE